MRPEQRTCKVCGITYTAKDPRKIYCSPTCNDRAKSARSYNFRANAQPKHCYMCQKAFMPWRPQHRFCSDACKTAHNNHNLTLTKICQKCGKPYKTRQHRQHYCSQNCAVSATVVRRILICQDCGKSFPFVGRTRAHRCIPCRKIYYKEYYRQQAAINHPPKHPGVGSGGAQWGTDNHQWKPADEHRSLRYRANWRRRCFKDWEKQCCACNSLSKIEVHHINGNPEDFHRGNLIPLCFDCHIHRVHVRRYKTAKEYIQATFAILPKKCRNKIAELSGKAERLIRTEGRDAKHDQGQSIGTAETIMSPRDRDTLLAG